MAKHRVIGLDIGTTAVRAAEIDFGSGSSPGTLTGYDEVALPLGAIRDGEVADQPTVAAALKELWAKAKFGSKDVVLGVGNQRVAVRELALPWMPLAQVRASLPYQVQDLLPMSTDDALLDFYPTDEFDGDGGRTLEGLLVAAARDTVAANVLAVEAAGLSPVMVDLNAFALLRSMTQGPLGSKTVALVDIGARITNVVIVSNGVPRFVRALPAGGQDATDAVARGLGVSNSDAENIKREIGVGMTSKPEYSDGAEALAHVAQNLVEAVRNTFTFYAGNQGQHPIDVVALTGGGAHLPGLGQFLASASRLAVTLGDPLSALQVSKSIGGRERFAGHESRMALPIGLALGVAS